LGVKKDAKASEIKKTYYQVCPPSKKCRDCWLTMQLAKKWHPDSNKEKGANERFLEIQSAYDVSSFFLGRGVS
jgi:molecular chaperone DnaJ